MATKTKRSTTTGRNRGVRRDGQPRPAVPTKNGKIARPRRARAAPATQMNKGMSGGSPKPRSRSRSRAAAPRWAAASRRVKAAADNRIMSEQPEVAGSNPVGRGLPPRQPFDRQRSSAWQSTGVFFSRERTMIRWHIYRMPRNRWRSRAKSERR